MMINAETSEERLLKLIRSKDCSYLPSARQADYFSVQSEDRRVGKPEESSRNGSRYFWLPLCLVIIGLGWFGYVSRPLPSATGNGGPHAQRVIPVPEQKPRVIAAVPFSAPQVLLTLAYPAGFPEYQQIWKYPGEALNMKDRPGEVQQQFPNVSAATSVSDQFRILGLAIGTNSNAILEDRNTKQIYTVTVGQRIGEVLVKDIRADSVLVQVGDHTIELMP